MTSRTAAHESQTTAARPDPGRWLTRKAIARITWAAVFLAVTFVISAAIVGYIAFNHFSRTIEHSVDERLERHAAVVAQRFSHVTLKSMLDPAKGENDPFVRHVWEQVAADAKAAGLRRILIFDRDGRVAIDSADITNRGRVDNRLRVDTNEIDYAIEKAEPVSSLLYEMDRPDGTTKLAKTAYAPVPIPPESDDRTVFLAAAELPIDYAERIVKLKGAVWATVAAFSAFIVLALALAVWLFRRMYWHLQAQAQRAQLAELSAAIAHEIKNPLAAMLTGLQLLRRGGTPQAQESLQGKLEREVKLIDRIVRDFLAYARGVQREPSPCTLGEVIARVRQQLTEEQEACLEVRADAGLELVTDPAALSQSVGNLCKNACDAALMKHRASSGSATASARALDRAPTDVGAGVETGPPKVVLEAITRGLQLVITVTDNGGGIPEALKDQLFRPFVSGGSGGSGLGLAIAKRLLSDLRGGVEMTRTGPNGTTFTVIVPITARTAVPKSKANRKQGAGTATAENKNVAAATRGANA